MGTPTQGALATPTCVNGSRGWSPVHLRERDAGQPSEHHLGTSLALHGNDECSASCKSHVMIPLVLSSVHHATVWPFTFKPDARNRAYCSASMYCMSSYCRGNGVPSLLHSCLAPLYQRQTVLLLRHPRHPSNRTQAASKQSLMSLAPYVVWGQGRQ
jgi:hypothetical protein